jgi:small conductance mechanosensitive channel
VFLTLRSPPWAQPRSCPLLAPPALAAAEPNVPVEVSHALALQGGWSSITNNLTQFAANVTLAIVILAVTLWAAGRLADVTRAAVTRMQRAHPDPTIQALAASLTRYAVVIVGLIAVLQQLGVQATSVIAVLGAASLAVGLAIQGTLSNVAAGVMILILRPYRVGDDVIINGQKGVVRALDLFATKLVAPEGQQVFVPNGKAFGEMIQNYTALGRRRIELAFGVDYADDLARGRRIAVETAKAHPKVLADPAPWAHVTALADSAVTITLRCWVRPSDYNDTFPDLIEQVKAAFEAAGLTFPYPHQVAVDAAAKDVEPAPTRQVRS